MRKKKKASRPTAVASAAASLAKSIRSSPCVLGAVVDAHDHWLICRPHSLVEVGCTYTDGRPSRRTFCSGTVHVLMFAAREMRIGRLVYYDAYEMETAS